MGSVYRVKAVPNFVANVETEARKWLRQQSKYFYAAGFDTLIKRWDKCINVGGRYVEKSMFFSRFEYHIFYVLYAFVTYVLTLPRSYTNYVNMGTACSRLQKQKSMHIPVRMAREETLLWRHKW
jgi:hypothetical protein